MDLQNKTIRGLLQDWRTVVDTAEETLGQLFKTIDTIQRKVINTAQKIFKMCAVVYEVVKKWDGICRKEIKNYISGLIGSFIIPTQGAYKGEAAEEVKSKADRYMAKYQRENAESSLQKEECTMQDGLSLSGVSCTKKGVDKWIVFYPGRGDNATWEKALPFLTKLHEETGYNVLSYNYRGVMNEGVATPHEILHDQEEILQKVLFSKGIDPKNVLLHGCGDLGGSFAMGVAENLQEKNTAVHVCNERSFASITDALKNFEFPLPVVGKPLSRIVSKLGLFLAKISHWDALDSKKSFTKVQGRVLVVGDTKAAPSFARFVHDKKPQNAVLVECKEDSDKPLSDVKLYEYAQQVKQLFQEA